MHILLVEDDLDLGRSIVSALASATHSTEWVRTIELANQFIDQDLHDCVLLDLNLPDGFGLDLIRGWRRKGIKTPLVVITASASLGDRLTGLHEGADDVMVKPFIVEELLARLLAVTRRAAGQASSTWSFGSLVLDSERRMCRLGDVAVALSPREFDALLILARSQGKILPKRRLAQQLVPLGDPLDFNALDGHIHNLRRKLGHRWIRTVRGIGYILEDDSSISGAAP
jgi:DNA-binding response OmpR family regulator